MSVYYGCVLADCRSGGGKEVKFSFLPFSTLNTLDYLTVSIFGTAQFLTLPPRHIHTRRFSENPNQRLGFVSFSLSPIMAFRRVGDGCPRWGCIRAAIGSGGGGGDSSDCRHRWRRQSQKDDDDDEEDDDDDGASLEAYDLAATGGGRVAAAASCCPGSRCVPAKKHRRQQRRKSAHGRCGTTGRDKSPGKPSSSPLTRGPSASSSLLRPDCGCCCWSRFSLLLTVGRRRRRRHRDRLNYRRSND